MLNNNEIEEVVSQIMNRNQIYKNLSIQKYYSLGRFLHSLKTDTFTFQKPSTWEDPFEDFISRLTNSHPDAIYNSFNITGGIYAMSTINKTNECDGMWSNFAQRNGILIHVKVKNLLKGIVNHLLDNGCCSDKKVYLNNLDIKNQLKNSIKIIKVEYLKDEDIALKFRIKTKTQDSDFNNLSYSMLSIKRKEFDYENEYRVFVNQELLKLKETQYLQVGYLKEVIEKIIISPRATSLRKNRIEKVFFNKYSINSNIVEQSTLYNIQYFKNKYNL